MKVGFSACLLASIEATLLIYLGKLESVPRIIQSLISSNTKDNLQVTIQFFFFHCSFCQYDLRFFNFWEIGALQV
jgi:hypothetical protein